MEREWGDSHRDTREGEVLLLAYRDGAALHGKPIPL